jgi:hypothetical protein
MSSGASVMTTDIVWRMHCGVLRDWAWLVRRHVLEDHAQPLNDHVIFDLKARHPRRVGSHQRLHPPLHETEGHVFGPQSGLSQGLDLLQ